VWERGRLRQRHPELLVGLYEAFRRGDLELPDQCQERVKPLRSAFSMGTFRP